MEFQTDLQSVVDVLQTKFQSVVDELQALKKVALLEASKGLQSEPGKRRRVACEHCSKHANDAQVAEEKVINLTDQIEYLEKELEEVLEKEAEMKQHHEDKVRELEQEYLQQQRTLESQVSELKKKLDEHESSHSCCSCGRKSTCSTVRCQCYAAKASCRAACGCKCRKCSNRTYAAE